MTPCWEQRPAARWPPFPKLLDSNIGLLLLQLGALAEFRADWPSALRMYGEAYGFLPQVGC